MDSLIRSEAVKLLQSTPKSIDWDIIGVACPLCYFKPSTKTGNVVCQEARKKGMTSLLRYHKCPQCGFSFKSVQDLDND